MDKTKNKKEIIVEYGNTVQYSFDDLIQTKDIDKDLSLIHI